jgi:hypothetical protein
VQDARRWVVGTCTAIGRPDVTECAELGVSELVTNALLHAAPPLSVRVRGTREHPRIEVRDGSNELPQLPTEETLDDEDDLLLTFGRGLSIVARCSTAWGVQVEERGKNVWFVPAPRSGDRLVPGVISGEAPQPVEAAPVDPVVIDVRGVPLRLFVEFQHHFRELRREVRLLALAHESDYPLAKDLSDLFATLDRDLRDGIGTDQIDRALQAGARTTDLQVTTSRRTAAEIGRFIELLDLADAFCRQERLLSLARTAEQRAFQVWLLSEFERQERREAPLAWQDADVDDRQSSVT